MIGANSTISVFRMQTTSNKDSFGEVANLSGLSAFIEPITAEPSTGFNDESVYLLHKCYIDDKPDIRISDKIIDDLAAEYTVKGVQYFRGGDVPSHTELTVSKKRDDYI